MNTVSAPCEPKQSETIAGKLRGALKQDKGFGGIGLLAVLAVIGSLAAILAPIANARYGESSVLVEETGARDTVRSTDEMIVDVTRVEFRTLIPTITHETFFDDYTDFDAVTSENLIAGLKDRIVGELTLFDRGTCEGFVVDAGLSQLDRSVRLINITPVSKGPADAVKERLC